VQRLFNIVGTRVPRGDFDEARRWYVDHVHLLFAYPGLLGARLWQRVPGAPEAGDAPDMLCCYDFGDSGSFADYDNSALRGEVERDRQSGWGRAGIEVSLRARFRRVYERRAGDEPLQARSRIAATSAEVAAGWQRALAQRAHEHGLRRLEIYRADEGEGGLWITDVDSTKPPVETPSPGPSWQGVYQPIAQWTR
jgi:catechol 2,3-dioxygenase-like lactoylglutathione lyase family enzyme